VTGVQTCALPILYVTTAGASEGAPKSVNGTSASVVSTSNNTITINGHGYVNDEVVVYDDGQEGADNPIKGLEVDKLIISLEKQLILSNYLLPQVPLVMKQLFH